MKYLLKSNGFTLLEVLVSLIILGISLIALAGLMTTTTKNNSVGGRLTEAATLAQDKLEELRATNWESIIPNSMNTELFQIRPGFQYTRNWIARLNGANPDIKEIEITINWTDMTTHSLRFFSVLAK